MVLVIVFSCVAGPLGVGCGAALLGVACAGAAAARLPGANAPLYGATLLISVIGLGAALTQLIGGARAPTVTLPLGLPWLGAHFRMDALSAFFLIVVNLGAAAASLFAVGYGAHESAPGRVLPFYPAFLAGMNLVVL